MRMSGTGIARLIGTLGAAVCLAGASTALQAQNLDVPRIATARDGPCRMEVRGRDSSFLIHVTGLIPGETLTMVSDSEYEIIKDFPKATEDGEYHLILIPLVKGHSRGIVHLSITGSRCRLKTSFPWRE